MTVGKKREGKIQLMHNTEQCTTLIRIETCIDLTYQSLFVHLNATIMSLTL